MTSYRYDDAYLVWKTLHVIDQSISVQRAMSLHFTFDPNDNHPKLPANCVPLLFELNADELIDLTPLQESLNRYINAERQKVDWTQQLGAQNARLRTLEMRARNIDQELSKSGLFRGRSHKELHLESQRLSDRRIRLLNEIHELTANLEGIDDHRRKLGERINTEDQFRNTRWVIEPDTSSGGIAASLTSQGNFLLSYLSEMKVDVLRGQSLSHALVYGISWSIQSE